MRRGCYNTSLLGIHIDHCCYTLVLCCQLHCTGNPHNPQLCCSILANTESNLDPLTQCDNCLIKLKSMNYSRSRSRALSRGHVAVVSAGIRAGARLVGNGQSTLRHVLCWLTHCTGLWRTAKTSLNTVSASSSLHISLTSALSSNEVASSPIRTPTSYSEDTLSHHWSASDAQ